MCICLRQIVSNFKKLGDRHFKKIMWPSNHLHYLKSGLLTEETCSIMAKVNAYMIYCEIISNHGDEVSSGYRFSNYSQRFFE